MVYQKFIDANTDLYGTPYPPTNHYGPINRFYRPLQDLLHPLQATATYYSLYRHTTLYNMADITKQISKG